MSEKEKGKSHPFAGILRPDEEVLWMTTIPYKFQTFWQFVRSPLGIGIILVPLVYIGVTLGRAGTEYGVAFVLGFLVLYMGLMMLGWMVNRLLKERPVFIAAYAITNQRLLYRDHTITFDFPLEGPGLVIEISTPDTTRIPELSIKWADSQGRVTALWVQEDKDDIYALRALVESVRDKRLKELQS